jgi:Xaa-Pro aminopeptidase
VEHPFLLFATGGHDADFVYATGFEVEAAGYLSFGAGDELLVAPTLELERARAQSRVAKVVDRRELGWDESQTGYAGWALPLARAALDRGIRELRVSGRLPAGVYEGLRAAGISPAIDPELLVSRRRRKSREEQGWIHSAQRAAEAACVEVIRQIAHAEIRDGLLWQEGRPLTSEHLMAAAGSVLEEIGYEGGEMIIAGAPGCGLPHFRGEGQLRAQAPIIIDLFPRGKTTGYFGDLTRTVIAGEVSERWRRMSDAVLAAFDAGIAEVRPGGDGQTAHRAACQALVDAGFGTVTAGLEGRDGARMNHSLGHGVGLEVHEAPALRDHPSSLESGDVVTIEPGLYELGQGGVRWEDLVLITDEGLRNFTSLPKSLDPAAYL